MNWKRIKSEWPSTPLFPFQADSNVTSYTSESQDGAQSDTDLQFAFHNRSPRGADIDSTVGYSASNWYRVNDG